MLTVLKNNEYPLEERVGPDLAVIMLLWQLISSRGELIHKLKEN